MRRLEFKEAPKGGEIQSKTTAARLEVKGEGEGGILHIKAYALAFGNIDSWGDIIMPGACDEFLAGPEADRMALCWQHDRATVIGKITAKGVDDHGMWIEADILPTTAGNDAAILLKGGAVKEFSIGYRAVSYHWEHKEGYEYDIRVLDKIQVYEVSPVTTAANPEAILVSAKADPDHHNQTQNPLNQKQDPKKMTPEEIAAMRESIEKAASERIAAEIKAVQDELKAAMEAAAAKDKQIDNLDKSMKALQSRADELEKARIITGFKSEMRAKLEEKKPALEKAFADGVKEFTIELELKTVYDIGTGLVSPNNFTSVAVDQSLEPVTNTANVFIEAFGLKPRTANKLGWLEPSAQNGADYVAELAANTNKSDVSFAEKSRKFGKIAHTMRISTEFSDWFEQLYDYCVNEGTRMILTKIDTEIWSGLGDDTANVSTGASPDKIYGLKSQATAFSALGTYEDANDADVIYDAAIQIQKEGFNANAAFVTWATYASLFNAKDKDGNRLFNQATQRLGALRVYPTAKLSAGEAFVADTSCAEVFAGNSFELEFIRNGVYDAYDVFYRRAAQTKVKTANKKGLIYVASLTTARAAINTPGSLSTIAGTVDSTAGAIKTKAVSTT